VKHRIAFEQSVVADIFAVRAFGFDQAALVDVALAAPRTAPITSSSSIGGVDATAARKSVGWLPTANATGMRSPLATAA
jgi:hypothetical protein